MSQLETAMGMTIAVFDQYARTDGNRQTLSKAELKTLLEKELPNFLAFLTAALTGSTYFLQLVEKLEFSRKSGKDKDAIDNVFKNLDENGDSQVDFKEFVIFVAALTCCCHKYFEQNAAK
ncbi:protein S100-P isoform X1 [Corvus hawaiiensis]|uniref:protein S100-P isoform X1 n=1 Tax=Corvus hawaiiensis TaxID=134902 RepID=UPI0020194A0D|nr:protein S100-P isoform X1 [Corvus hawaiiensis]